MATNSPSRRQCSTSDPPPKRARRRYSSGGKIGNFDSPLTLSPLVTPERKRATKLLYTKIHPFASPPSTPQAHQAAKDHKGRVILDSITGGRGFAWQNNDEDQDGSSLPQLLDPLQIASSETTAQVHHLLELNKQQEQEKASMQSLLEEIQLSLTDVKSRLDDSEFGGCVSSFPYMSRLLLVGWVLVDTTDPDTALNAYLPQVLLHPASDPSERCWALMLVPQAVQIVRHQRLKTSKQEEPLGPAALAPPPLCANDKATAFHTKSSDGGRGLYDRVESKAHQILDASGSATQTTTILDAFALLLQDANSGVHSVSVAILHKYMQLALRGAVPLSAAQEQLILTACRSLFGPSFSPFSPFPDDRPWLTKTSVLYGPGEDNLLSQKINGLKSKIIKKAKSGVA